MMDGNMIGGKLCRLCLLEAEVMCPIFVKNGPQGTALPQRIMSCAQIKVAEDDGLPSSICYQCLAQVDKSYQFKLQCEKSDASLRQHLQEKLDSEADGWDVMNFTPEVIINEGDMHEQTGENGEHVESESDESLKSLTQPYQLSAVEALLRHHGTEIKVQGVTPNNKEHKSQQVVPSNGSNENVYPQNGEEYYPMYGGVEATMLFNEVGQAGPSPKSRDGQKLFQCRLCPKSYSFSSALSRHKAVHNTALRPHVCQICKKGFAEPEKLERHTKTHLGDQSYNCETCGRVFKALATFEKHKLMTQGKCRMFSCKHCKIGFPSRTKLKIHICGTDEEISYNCPECNKSFNRKANLETHMGTHTGERPFLCTVCGKGFRQKVNLMEHFQRKHSQVRPYNCDVCGSRFVTKQDLVRHYRKHIDDD
uniref:Protein krueppel n=1 Tax=Clastoptera arizonana TaxID=38151 RepID=A0A1B6CCA0_9HEMI